MGLWQGAPGAAVSHPVGGRGLALPAGEDGHHRLHQAPGGGREAEEQGEQPSHHHQMPPDFGDTGADLLGEKITKFTDSLMRHRQLHQTPQRPSVLRGQRPETGLRRTEERPGSRSRRSPVKSSSLGSLASEAG